MSHIADPTPECTVHPDCRITEQCHQGSCVEACRLITCGTNALCNSFNHDAECSCPPGYTGNPLVACIPSKLSIHHCPFYAHNATHNIHSCTFTVAPIVVPGIDPGCSDDTECPVHKACINNICRDPCIVEDPCARNAFCKVNLHEPECTCPPGFTGDPRVLCVARKFTQIICLIHYRTLQNSRG